MTFGEKLHDARIKKGLTQRELAKLANLGLNTISNYESGKTYPKSREVYDTLASILEIDRDYLRNENEDFISEASERYGNKGKKQADQLVKELSGLFAGGELSEHEKDGVMRALQEIYWECKEENIEKYTPKKYKDSKKYSKK